LGQGDEVPISVGNATEERQRGALRIQSDGRAMPHAITEAVGPMT